MRKVSLCWNCKNSLGFCSWSDRSFTPVEGWDAEAREIHNSDGSITKTFFVRSCPHFKLDELSTTETITDKDLIKHLNITTRTFYRRYTKEQKRALKIILFRIKLNQIL